MLKLASYDIVFQEIPDEITLALNLSNCCIRCKGCHSPHLMDDIGELLDRPLLDSLIDGYRGEVSCICFMGGDSSVRDVDIMAKYIHSKYEGGIKVGWYSGRENLDENISLDNFDYIKLGPYIERLGGLNSLHTNQRMYMVEKGNMVDITHRFHRKGLPL